jgi:long-chain fatty acid transport protein
MVKKSLTILSAILLFAGSLFASGFQINENAARAMSMGGAFTGVANDASAVYFNPAAITQLSGTRVSLGSTVILPKASFRGVSPAITEYKMQDQTFTPVNFYLTRQISKKLYVGFGVNNPYGLGSKWDDNWIGKYLAVETEVRTFFFAGNVAYQVTDCLSLAVGINYAYGDVTIMKYVPLPDPIGGDFKLSLTGDGTSIGFNVAAFYKPSEKFSLGVSYRSENKFDFAGTAKSENGPAALASQLPTGDITASLTTPMNLTVGVGFFPNEKLTLSADFQYVGWSSYDKLAVDFKDPNTEDIDVNRDYQNSWIARAGMEYKLNDNLALRGGLLYDKNPVKDALVEPSLPDADRVGFNAGLGYKLSEKLSVDLSYMFIRFAERTITNSEQTYTSGNSPFNGVYNSYAHLFGINLSYNF